MMKHFIKNLCLFIPFAFFIYILLVSLSAYFLPNILTPNINYLLGSAGQSYLRLKEARKFEGKLDILFLGSSHAYRGFDPRNFKNLSTFNLGSSAQTPIQTEAILNRYLDKLKPKLVIYEVSPELFSSDGVESSLDIIANDRNDIQSLKMAFKVNNIKVYNTLVYSFFRDLFGLNNSFSQPLIMDNDTYISGGFVERKISFFRNVNHVPRKALLFNKKQIVEFENIVACLNKRNIILILVYAPITSTLYKSYTNINSFDSLIRNYSSNYYDFNKILKLNDTLCFYDSNHLNKNGVNLFNRELVKIIKKEVKESN